MPWLIFLGSAVVIVYAGTKLSQYGDQIAEKTGLGGLWIGVLLMAGATSLPEVFTTISASLLDAPNLAVGDLLGAVMTNMLTLGAVDLYYRRKRVWQRVAFEHALVASLAITLTGITGFFVLLDTEVTLWGVGVGSLVLAVIYVLGMRLVFLQEDLKRRERERESVIHAEEGTRRAGGSPPGLRRASMGFAAAALAILVAAPLLADSAVKIAEATGISTTFIGTSLVAITTSLPELVTTFAAVRLGAFDLAVGNLFGSNAFNMCVMFFADVAYRPGSLLNAVNNTHAVTALVGILLMNVGLMGIIYRAKKRFPLIEPGGVLIVVGYLLGMWMLFRLGG